MRAGGTTTSAIRSSCSSVLLFAVLLAFVYNDVQAGYNEAAEAINGECGALHGAAMLAHALPDEQGRPVVTAIAGYTQSVLTREWPMMARRQRSPEASGALQAALERASSAANAAAGDGYVRSQILALLVEAHARRETRIYQMGLSVPPALWVVLIGNAAVLVGFVILAGVESSLVQMFFAAAFAGLHGLGAGAGAHARFSVRRRAGVEQCGFRQGRAGGGGSCFEGGSLLFLKKKKQKDLCPFGPREEFDRPAWHNQTKVSCFFFSKKKCSFPFRTSAPPPPHAQ